MLVDSSMAWQNICILVIPGLFYAEHWSQPVMQIVSYPFVFTQTILNKQSYDDYITSSV